MQNQREILETVRMIEQQHLDIRTITMGISLYDCADADAKAACRRIYDKVTQRPSGSWPWARRSRRSTASPS